MDERYKKLFYHLIGRAVHFMYFIYVATSFHKNGSCVSVLREVLIPRLYGTIMHQRVFLSTKPCSLILLPEEEEKQHIS